MEAEAIKREIKHIQGLTKVLAVLAREVKSRGNFTEGDLEVLKHIGSDILFKGVSLGFLLRSGKPNGRENRE